MAFNSHCFSMVLKVEAVVVVVVALLGFIVERVEGTASPVSALQLCSIDGPCSTSYSSFGTTTHSTYEVDV